MKPGFPARPITRFSTRVAVQPDGCWLWTGHLFKSGYGQFSIGTRCVRAHRFAYELFLGPIPDGMQLDHLCRVRACVSPLHLEPVTARENTLRGDSPSSINARKTHCIHGHALTGANLHVRPDGTRRCRTCAAERQARTRLAVAS